MKRWFRPAAIAVLVGVVVGLLLSVPTPVPEFSPLDAIHNRSQFRDGSEMRVPGTVVGPIESRGDGITFELADEDVAFTVLFPGRSPQGLQDGVAVTVQGTWVDDVLEASAVEVDSS